MVRTVVFFISASSISSFDQVIYKYTSCVCDDGQGIGVNGSDLILNIQLTSQDLTYSMYKIWLWLTSLWPLHDFHCLQDPNVFVVVLNIGYVAFFGSSTPSVVIIFPLFDIIWLHFSSPDDISMSVL